MPRKVKAKELIPKPVSLEPGKLYTKNNNVYHRPGAPENRSLVLCLGFEKKPPIYHVITLLHLETNQTQQLILDRFNVHTLLNDYREVTDEAQIEAAKASTRAK